MTDRFTINQKVQIGAEVTPGTNVSASKLLECYDWVMGINGDLVTYTPTGHKYPNVQEENTEWVDLTMGGNFDYNGVIYPLASIMGDVNAVTHGSSATAKDWIFTPPTSGSVTPQTYTIEQGDSVRAQKVNYALFTKFGYTGTRKGFTNSGTLIAQPIQDSITLTSSPTAVAISPVVGKQVNVYLDPTSGALGTTQLTRALSFDFSMDSVYNVLWVLNRSTAGWTTHVDTMPKTAIKLKVEADAQGMALLTSMQAGTTQFLRFSAQGTQIAADGPGAVNATFQHDMAIKIGKPSTFADDQGIYAIEWTGTVIEDIGWAKAQTITVTNLISAL